MSLPTLYKMTSTGAQQEWTISVEGSTIVKRFGQTGGAIQEARDTITVGKNVGRANETTPEQQALLEAQSQWEKKQKAKGYHQSVEAAVSGEANAEFVKGGIDPMLAHTYEKQGSKIKWPAFIQPKLDGHRCIAIVKDSKASLWTRTRKPILSMPHIIKALETAGVGDAILDGELFVKGPAFEQLTSFIRPAYAKPGHEIVELHVYDIVTDQSFADRWSALQDVAATVDHPIHIVETREVQDEGEAMETYADFVASGYEGAMLRNTNGGYESKRSYNLIKVKAMLDSEFRIVDVVEGRGRMAGRGIFECETGSGATFRVKMAGPLDSLNEYLINKDKYVGLDLTVQYQELTADGVPRFPVGLRLRTDI